MLDEIVTVVKKCGDIILFADGAERNVSSKEGRANFVTKYDVAVQAYLEEELLKILPEAVFIGEEGEHSKAIGEGYAFIVLGLYRWNDQFYQKLSQKLRVCGTGTSWDYGNRRCL